MYFWCEVPKFSENPFFIVSFLRFAFLLVWTGPYDFHGLLARIVALEPVISDTWVKGSSVKYEDIISGNRITVKTLNLHKLAQINTSLSDGPQYWPSGWWFKNRGHWLKSRKKLQMKWLVIRGREGVVHDRFPCSPLFLCSRWAFPRAWNHLLVDPLRLSCARWYRTFTPAFAKRCLRHCNAISRCTHTHKMNTVLFSFLTCTRRQRPLEADVSARWYIRLSINLGLCMKLAMIPV